MATLFVDHTYKRYIFASTAVIQWLFLNAELCTPAEKPSKSNQKRAKRRAKNNPSTKKTTLSISEYLDLAKTIVASPEPDIEIPAWLLHNLSDMITIRRMLARHFSFSATETDDSSDVAQDISDSAQEPPSQSICTLEEVLELLKDKQVKDAHPPPSARLFSTAHELDPLCFPSHPYFHLFPEEPVKAGQDWQKTSARQKCVLQPSKDEEERMLMVQCFFEDFHAMRKYLRLSWEAYSEAQADLYMVSAATNTAIAVLQGMVEDMESFFPNQTLDYEQFLPLAARWMNASEDIFSPFFAKTQQDIDSSVWAVADAICLPAYAILKQFIPDRCAAYRSSELSHSRPLPPGDTPAEKFTQAKHILNHFLAEVIFVASQGTKGNIPIADNLSIGLWRLVDDPKIYAWIPFACTMHLDICGALGENLDRGHLDLLLSCHRFHKTIDEFWRFNPEIVELAPGCVPHQEKVGKSGEEQQTRRYNRSLSREETEPKPEPLAIDQHVNNIIDLQTSLLYIEGDELTVSRSASLYFVFDWKTLKPQPFHLLKIHPLLCGVLEFQFMLRMQDASLEAANDWGSIMSVAWLYRALGRENIQAAYEPWHDMEIVLATHNAQFWPEPKNTVEILSRFEELTEFQAADYWKPLPLGVNPSEFLRPLPGCHQLLYDHYASKPLDRKPLDRETFHEKWKWTQSLFLTPQLILIELSRLLKSEFCSLKFNYLSMHMRCMTLLNKIHHEIDGKLAERFGRPYIYRVQQLPFLTGYLLTDFVMHKSVARLRERRQRKWRGHEAYESPSRNNEVCDYAPADSGNIYEDFLSRHPDCPSYVPLIFGQVGDIIEELVLEEGDLEHRDLKRSKDAVENTAWLANDNVAELSNREEAMALMHRWIMIHTALRDNLFPPTKG